MNIKAKSEKFQWIKYEFIDKKYNLQKLLNLFQNFLFKKLTVSVTCCVLIFCLCSTQFTDSFSIFSWVMILGTTFSFAVASLFIDIVLFKGLSSTWSISLCSSDFCDFSSSKHAKILVYVKISNDFLINIERIIGEEKIRINNKFQLNYVKWCFSKCVLFFLKVMLITFLELNNFWWICIWHINLIMINTVINLPINSFP